MKLEKLTIKNFRGIGSAEIDINDFTTLIGPNNIGKSTILNAIHMVLDNKKPKIEDWPGQKSSDEIMEIVCEFAQLEDWERNKPAISQLLFNDKLIIRLTSEWNENKTDYTYEYSVYYVEDVFPWKDYNYTSAKKDELCRDIFNAIGISNASDFKDRIDELEAYTLLNYPESVDKTEGWHVKKFANSLQQAVPHVMYVPASFKIEDDLKTTGNSPFAFLFSNKLFPKVKNDKAYQDYIVQAGILQNKLKGQSEDGSQVEGLSDALNQVSETLNQILDFDSKVRLAIGDVDVESLFSRAATFLVGDELETNLQYQGSGVQRALAFAMLESNASVESEVSGEYRTVIVLYEEPELYIHPHLMRRLKKALQTRSKSPKWQVICSTHSPFLINIAEEPKSLKLIKRNSGNERKVNQFDSKIFEKKDGYDERTILRAALDFHPTVCESFFAKRVVVVEGDTEVAVFGMVGELANKLGIQGSIDKDTSVVSAGGKWTIPALVKVLNALDIDYRVIHDADRKNMSEEQLKNLSNIHPYNANKKIEEVAGDKVYVVDDTFEHVLWDKDEDVIKSSDKPFNSWSRVRDYLDGKLNLSQKCESTLKDIIEFAFCK